MAKTHELGLSFHTVGKVLHALSQLGIELAVRLNNFGVHLMEDVKFFESNVFWHALKVDKGTPLHHRAYTGEIDPPFRSASSHVIRAFPFKRALVVGSWQPKPEELTEEDMLYRATNLDHERADEQSTEFDAAVVGLSPADRVTLPLTPPTGNEGGCGDSCGCQ